MHNIEALKGIIGPFCDLIGSSGQFVGESSAMLVKGAKTELAMFMMYLSASDGEIKWEEARTISSLCDLNLTPNTIDTFIRDNNIYSTEFEQKVPITLRVMVDMDNILIRQGQIDGSFPSDSVVDIYELIADAIIKSDETESENEKADALIYINMLKNYILQNRNMSGSASGKIVKNTGTVSAPTKSGVSAPKKG